ncbi:MAG TPA: repressor LexA [Planctomycetes bacterium]|nr:repressor LexA [Planctomycetota bacterium]
MNLTTQITPRQLQVLKTVAQLQLSRCYSPTIAEVAEVLSVSRTTVFEHIGVLREKGLLARSRGKLRSLKLTLRANRLLEQDLQAESIRAPEQGVPLLGTVAAGLPTEAIENPETMSLRDMFGPSDEIFTLRVSGDSMLDEGILDGDYVVCKRSASARDGQIVVAIVDESEATLKKFYAESDRARLEPANSLYNPIYSDNCRIEAVVLGLLRRL